MSVFCKVLLIIAVIAIVLGAALFVVALAVSGWNLGNISSKNNVTNTYELNEKLESISIKGSSDSVVIAPSMDGSCRVVCNENERKLHSVTVEDGVLKIAENDNLSWLERMIFSWNKTSVTVYIPKGAYEKLTVDITTGDVSVSGGFTFADVDISLTTGDVSVFDITASGVSLSLTTGDVSVSSVRASTFNLKTTTSDIEIATLACSGQVNVELTTGDLCATGVSCKSFSAMSGSTGDVSLSGVIAEESISVKRTTGDITLDGVDAKDIYVKTTTGDVKGSLLSGKSFDASATTGKVRVPEDSNGGKCEIKTTTGDVEITVSQ